MRILRTVFIILIASCNSNHHNINTSSFDDYIKDKELVKKVDEYTDCDSIQIVFNQLKTLDGMMKVKYYLDNCNILHHLPEPDDNSEVVNKFYDIQEDDQIVRDNFNIIMDSIQDSGYMAENFNSYYKMRKFYYDSIIAKQDSINLLKFNKIIDSLDEWPGAYFISYTYGNPKLPVLVGHMPERYYKKYTLMAYESAAKNKEYWKRVKGLINFSKKYFIEDTTYFSQNRFVNPLMFIEIKDDYTVDENSDLTKLELSSIISTRFLTDDNSPIYYKLSSSIQNDGNRKNLLDNAKDFFERHIDTLQQKEFIIDYQREKHDTYKLYYEIVDGK